MSLILTSLTDGVLTITLNEPARRNPLSQAMRDDIVGALTPLPADLRAVILTGADGAFSAGGDLASMPPQDREASVERMNGVGDFMRSLESALQAENAGQAELFFTEDFREGKQAFFDKRSPQFTRR